MYNYLSKPEAFTKALKHRNVLDNFDCVNNGGIILLKSMRHKLWGQRTDVSASKSRPITGCACSIELWFSITRRFFRYMFNDFRLLMHIHLMLKHPVFFVMLCSPWWPEAERFFFVINLEAMKIRGL